MEQKNLVIWDKLRTPPANAIKPILAGRLKGKLDLNPQWRYEAITEVFGICGVGWKYTIDKLWTEVGSQDQVMCFALISFYYKDEIRWSDAIPGIGGSMLITKESSGLHSSDEGYKMAVTDALSVALKMIGVGADVYRGTMEGSKYDKEESLSTKKKGESSLLVMDITTKEGTNKQGNPYKLFTITDSNDIEHKTFDKNLVEIAEKAQEEGLEVEIESKESKFGNDLINIEIKKTVKNDEAELQDEGEFTPEKCYVRAEELIKSVQEITNASHLKNWEQKYRKEMFEIKKVEPDAFKKITVAIGQKMGGLA